MCFADFSSSKVSQSKQDQNYGKHLTILALKKGFRREPLNDRLIMLTSVLCKTLERLLAKRLTMYLDIIHILSNNQVGFRIGKSAED